MARAGRRLYGLGDDHQTAGDDGGLEPGVGQLGQVGRDGRVAGWQRLGAAMLAETEKIAPAPGATRATPGQGAATRADQREWASLSRAGSECPMPGANPRAGWDEPAASAAIVARDLLWPA